MKIKLRSPYSNNRTEVDIKHPKDAVEDAISVFETPNSETAIKEEVLERVFGGKKEIGDICSVLHKCTILNIYYSTQIKDKDLLAMARRIISLNDISYNNMGLVDYLLFFETDRAKYRRLVNLIAYYKDKDSVGNCYSFASKFCSWHSQEKFPIVDSYAKGLLYRITENSDKKYMEEIYKNIPGRTKRKQQSNLYNHELNDYYIYCQLYDGFIDEFGLSGMDYKKIDEYIWQYSKSLFTENSENSILDQLITEKDRETIEELINIEEAKTKNNRTPEQIREQVRKKYIDEHFVQAFTISSNYEKAEEILEESKNVFRDIFN